MSVSLASVLERPRVRVSCPSDRWTIDVEAVMEACAFLCVRGPVNITTAHYARRRWAGMHSFDPDTGEHAVTVWRHATAEYASRILWHELTHAAQSSRGDVYDMGTTEIRRLFGDVAYREDPREREARANELRAETHPLVVA